jgi:hypothetical protein
MSFKDWEEFMDVIREAKVTLEDLEEKKKAIPAYRFPCKATYQGHIFMAPHSGPHSLRPSNSALQGDGNHEFKSI